MCIECEDKDWYLPNYLRRKIEQGKTFNEYEKEYFENLKDGECWLLENGDGEAYYDVYEYCPYCGRKLTPEEDYKKLLVCIKEKEIEGDFE